jgi:cytochrome c556
MNMVRVPGRVVARPGEKTKSEGPDAPELTAEEIKAKIDQDRGKFLKYSNDLQDQAVKALAIARKHDAQGLFDIGEDIDNACEACHLEYWYPNDKAAKAAYEADQKLRAAEAAKKKQQGK